MRRGNLHKLCDFHCNLTIKRATSPQDHFESLLLRKVPLIPKFIDNLFTEFLAIFSQYLHRAFITESSSSQQPKHVKKKRRKRTKKKSHTKKRKKFRSFFFFRSTNKAQEIRRWADTERKHSENFTNLSLIHKRIHSQLHDGFYSLIVVFFFRWGSRAEEMLSKEIFFVFQFCFVSRTVQSRFPLLPTPKKN